VTSGRAAMEGGQWGKEASWCSPNPQ
jgi:hypothetical protein